jgi:hypothetical protein
VVVVTVALAGVTPVAEMVASPSLWHGELKVMAVEVV